MITPYPRTSEPYYSRDDETEVDNERIRSEEEIYEETPDPNDEELSKRGSATGDDLDLLTQRRSQGWDAPRKNPYAPPEPEPDPEPETYTEYETYSETPSETPTNEYETESPPPETEAQRAKRLRDEEWFNFRMETVNSPNSVGGISKAEFFKNGYTAAEYNEFAARKIRESRTAKRTKKAILARNGFEIGWRPPQPEKPLAPRRSVGEEVAGGISRSYDLLGLNRIMAGAMAYDNTTQQSLSNSVFGELPTSKGSYDVLGIGFATNESSSGGGSMSFGDIFGFGDAPRRGAAPAGEIPDLFGFRNSAAPRRRSPAKKPKAAVKKPVRKAPKKSRGTTTPPKPISRKKPVKNRKQMSPISKKVTAAKKTTVKKIGGGKKSTTKKFSPRGGGRTADKRRK